jgi:hypothetical protein
LTERDSDIDFDFFDDEPETEEATQRRRIPRAGPPGGGGGGPRRPLRPAPGLTPLLRLTGLIAAVILAAIVLVFWIQSCQGASKRRSYQSYIQKVSVIAHDSAQTGRDLNDLLTTPGEKQSDIVAKLANLSQQQTQSVGQASRIQAPGPLREEHAHLIEALQFRVSGLNGLRDAFQRSATAKNTADVGGLLAAQAQRLVASDVVWDDLFQDPARAELRRQGVSGVNVPDSNFVQNPELANAGSMVRLFQRIHSGPSTAVGSGPHGDAVVAVKVLPSGSELSTSTENTITVSTELAFQVTVKNSGESQEVQVPVTLTIEQSPKPLVARQTIDLINAGEEKTVTFTNLDLSGAFGVKSTLKVEVKRVPGETNLANNVATYRVIFSV